MSEEIYFLFIKLFLLQDRNGLNSPAVFGISAPGILIYHDRHDIDRIPWKRIGKISQRKNRIGLKLVTSDVEDDQTRCRFFLPSELEAFRLWELCVEFHSFYRMDNLTKISQDHNDREFEFNGSDLDNSRRRQSNSDTTSSNKNSIKRQDGRRNSSLERNKPNEESKLHRNDFDERGIGSGSLRRNQSFGTFDLTDDDALSRAILEATGLNPDMLAQEINV